MLIATLLGAIIPQKIGTTWYSQFLTLLFFLYLTPILILWNFNKYLSLFIGVCVFSSFFVAKISPRALVLLGQLEMLSLVSYGVSKFSAPQRKAIRRVLIGIFLFQCLYLLFQFLNKDIFFNRIGIPSEDMLVGFMGASGQLGSAQAVLSPIVLGSSLLFLPFSLISIAVSKSFFSCVSIIVGLSILVYFLHREHFKLFLILIVLFGFFFSTKIDTVNSSQVSTRVSVWRHSITSVLKGEVKANRNGSDFIVKCNPLFGYGFGNFLIIFPYVPQQENFNYSNEKFTHAHNDFIETGFFETGIIGAIFLTLLIAMFFVGFCLTKKTPELAVYFSSIVVYMINASGNFVSHMAFTGLCLAVIYGLYEGVRRENGAIAKLV